MDVRVVVTNGVGMLGRSGTGCHEIPTRSNMRRGYGVNLQRVTYEGMRLVVQVLVVRVDIGAVTYESMTSVSEVSGSGPGCQSGYRSGDL